MVGETNYGYCFRENKIHYMDGRVKRCKMPLTDGKPCGDTKLGGPRCPYNLVGCEKEGPKLDYSKLVFITYPECNRAKSKE